MAKRKPTPDTIVEIPLGDDHRAYGRVLTLPFVAVYDLRVRAPITDAAAIAARPVLFVVAVYDRTFTSGRWPAVGKVPASLHPVAIPDQFMQDAVDPRRCQIIGADGRMRPATIDECRGLEAASVWEGEHVEERIRDHHAGRPNVHLQHLRLKQP